MHIWIETDDALYTDGQHVGVHAASDGVKVLTLPGRCRVVNALTGKPVDSDGFTVRLSIKRAETVLLRLEPAE